MLKCSLLLSPSPCYTAGNLIFTNLHEGVNSYMPEEERRPLPPGRGWGRLGKGFR